MEQMFEIDQARPEDAAQLLAYLKRVGSETDNLTFGAEGLPGTAEQEAAYLRRMLESPDDVQYVVRYRGSIVADGSLHRASPQNEPPGGNRCFRGKGMLGKGSGQRTDGRNACVCKAARHPPAEFAGAQ